jgi:hypothetical protein
MYFNAWSGNTSIRVSTKVFSVVKIKTSRKTRLSFYPTANIDDENKKKPPILF